MSKPVSNETDKESVFDNLNVDELLEKTPGGKEAREMIDRNK